MYMMRKVASSRAYLQVAVLMMASRVTPLEQLTSVVDLTFTPTMKRGGSFRPRQLASNHLPAGMRRRDSSTNIWIAALLALLDAFFQLFS
jgi:hypothetical protein